MLLRSFAISALLLLGCRHIHAQELYVFSEPASNMPAHSLSAKVLSKLPISGVRPGLQRYNAELMFGLNKKWMLHGGGFFSNFYQHSVRAEAAKVYAKYRFLSNDDVHQHFRMAAFASAAYSRNPFVYDELNLNGDNSGVEGGIIATQLVNRFAVSATVGGLQAITKSTDPFALNYSLSAGYLVFPRQYSSFRQTNLNIYLEAMGMNNLKMRHSMFDLAPAMQLIFNSNLKFNAGYRFQVSGNMSRIATRGFYLSIERTFLSALK